MIGDFLIGQSIFGGNCVTVSLILKIEGETLFSHPSDPGIVSNGSENGKVQHTSSQSTRVLLVMK